MMLGHVSMHGVDGSEMVGLRHLEASQTWVLSLGTIDLYGQQIEGLVTLLERALTQLRPERIPEPERGGWL